VKICPLYYHTKDSEREIFNTQSRSQFKERYALVVRGVPEENKRHGKRGVDAEVQQEGGELGWGVRDDKVVL
jgi:hypothetical protein